MEPPHRGSGAGELVGFGGYKGPPVDGEVEIGYGIAPERQVRGLATAAGGGQARGDAAVSSHPEAHPGLGLRRKAARDGAPPRTPRWGGSCARRDPIKEVVNWNW